MKDTDTPDNRKTFGSSFFDGFFRQLSKNDGLEKPVEVDSPKVVSDSRSVTAKNQVGVGLSDDEHERLAKQVDELFDLNFHHPDFIKYTDRFHFRIEAAQQQNFDLNVTQNVDLTLELLTDLRVVLDALFPKEIVPGWSFKRQFEAAKDFISFIMENIKKAREYLRKDISAIDDQKVHYHDGMTKLRHILEVSRALREGIEQRLTTVGGEHQEAIKSNVVFYLVQREHDLLTELAVTTQAYLGIDAVRKTNVNLLLNVERVMSTTIQALRNAVFVANNVEAKTVNYMIDAREIVMASMSFEAKQVRDMLTHFSAIDEDIGAALMQAESTGELPRRPETQRIAY